MTPSYFLETALKPALKLLPPIMTSRPAIVMILAIGLQESRFQYRRQVGGPARGYLQFEQGGGVRGVLTHAATRQHIQSALQALDYPAAYDAGQCYAAIEHNDILAAVFARLNLWWSADPLPTDSGPAWDYYVNTWRPGRPHRHTWDAFYAQAWAAT